MSWRLADFHYDLPPERIARYPLAQRSASRLLHLDRSSGQTIHRRFVDLPMLLTPNDLLVCNNTRVIAARLLGQKDTGGRIEVLVERILDDNRMLAQIRSSKKPKPQSFLFFPKNPSSQISLLANSLGQNYPNELVRFKVLQRRGDLFEISCEDPRPILEVIEAIGQVPIPPYFQRAPEVEDKERYQTIYAEQKGSVAAPTAGLHFDADLFAQMKDKGIEIGYVTLHVGAGTFASIRVEDITEHTMHAEQVVVSPLLCEQIKNTRRRGGRVVAVGTTTARSLEAASRNGEIQAFSGDTDLFIYPGFQFQCVDALITNFHLPGSTLLMLVAAFGQYEHVMAAYKIAIEHDYRFFSYGDAMFISNESG